jgi:hypothetical protein
MSKFVHALGHLGLIIAGAVAQYSGYIPGKYKPLALAVQGVSQAALALVNHAKDQP